MDYPPNDGDQGQFPPPQPNTSYPPQQPGASYPLSQPPYPYQPPPPPVPPKKGTSPALWVAIGVIVVLFLGLFSISLHTSSQNTLTTTNTSTTTQDTPQPTDTPVPTTTTPSITDQVTQALGATLDPNDTVYDTVNESNGAVAVDVYTITTVSLDDGGHARIFAVEKAIWQANISGISSVQATVYELDTDGTQIPMYKAIVSADRAQSIPWDSISPDAAWRLQYNETWTCRGGIGCPYTTPVTNGP